MTRLDWPRLVAKVFMVLTLGVGAGFVGGSIAFLKIGPEGQLINSAFGHIAEVIGWGVGCLTASLTTCFLLYGGGGADAGKPVGPPSRGLD
jgi:hypothetical protein